MTTFVLVHGGRHGGWCWKRVRDRLSSMGHDVYNPTLTGLGERSHLASPAIDLDTHIHDITGVFEWEDLHDVVLVGHSYGGMPITGAAELVGERIARLVYFDAFLPRSGESALDLVDAESARAVRDLIDTQGEGWYVPPSDAAFFDVTDPSDAAWVNSKTTRHPAATYRQPLGSVERAWALPTAYIECLQGTSIPPSMRIRAAERARADEHFRYLTLDAGHNAMITEPEGLTTILLETAPD